MGKVLIQSFNRHFQVNASAWDGIALEVPCALRFENIELLKSNPKLSWRPYLGYDRLLNLAEPTQRVSAGQASMVLARQVVGTEVALPLSELTQTSPGSVGKAPLPLL